MVLWFNTQPFLEYFVSLCIILKILRHQISYSENLDYFCLLYVKWCSLPLCEQKHFLCLLEYNYRDRYVYFHLLSATEQYLDDGYIYDCGTHTHSHMLTIFLFLRTKIIEFVNLVTDFASNINWDEENLCEHKREYHKIALGIIVHHSNQTFVKMDGVHIFIAKIKMIALWNFNFD